MKFKLELTTTDTNILKGVALLLLLLHHLFYIQRGLYDDIHLYDGHYFVNELGKFGKLCVAIFVFLSGYGLTVQANKMHKINLLKFYSHRFSKLYLNYWFIWLMFVPIGILFFHRTFDIIYINNIWEKLVIDILGLSYALGFYGYNATWWFYSCIIVLYLLFPFIYKLLGKYSVLLFVLGFGVYLLHMPVLRAINHYLISFVLGMITANGINVKSSPHCLKYVNRYTLSVAFVLACFIRNILGGYAILWDSFICLIGIVLFKKIKLLNVIARVLEFLGKHSMNIFLFHTFIYLYYFKEFIFWSRNPLIIYSTLLIVCIFVSIVLEFIKKNIGFYKIKL